MMKKESIQKIPEQWRQQVVAILKTRNPECIRVTARAEMNWDDLFGEFLYQLYDAFAVALSNSEIEGKQIFGMVPEGETWAFFFVHKNRTLYGKVSLLKDGKIVLIYSAHTPLKGDKL